MKLLLFVKTLDGGTGTYVLDMLEIKKLFKPGELEIKTLVLEKPSFRKINGQEFSYWSKPNYYPEKYTLSLNNIWKFVKELFWLKKHVSSYNPDIVLTVDSHCMLLNEISRLYGKSHYRTISTIHNNLQNVLFVKSSRSLYCILPKIIKFFLDRSNLVICVSNNLAKDTQRFFKLKGIPITIYNGLSQIFSRSPSKFRDADNKIIVNVGRHAEQKDHKTLFLAFQSLVTKFPKLELWLVGEGPRTGFLKKLAHRLEIPGRVKFFGWVQNPLKYIRNSDILVLSSKREGFPYVLIEAMSQGKPVVSTDSPFGPEEILKDGKYGKLIPVGDAKKMEEAIEKLLSNEKVYNHFAKVALERSKTFTKAKMLESYKTCIEKLATANE